MVTKPETLFRQKVMRDLTLLEDIAIFSIQQRTIKGDPDLMLCVKGKFVALELKSENGRASKLQEYKINKINQAGGIGLIVYPENWPEVLNLVQSLARGKI